MVKTNLLVALGLPLCLVGCSLDMRHRGHAADGGADMPASSGGCQGFGCFQVDCGGGTSTTLTGRVTAPNGIDPVFEAQVYVPASVPEFSPGVQCEACADPIGGMPVVSTATAIDGTFTLTNVPATTQVPVIVQKGRFRRINYLDITACSQGALTLDQGRLPRNQSEGNLPKMAVGVGHYDQIECVLRSIGIDESEFTAPSGNGAVHLYDNWQGGGPSLEALLANSAQLQTYNLLFINCTETSLSKYANQALTKTNLFNYVNSGGRLYVTDWAYDFTEQIPEFAPYISYDGKDQKAPEPMGAADWAWSGTPLQGTIIDANLAAWMKAAGASPSGSLSLEKSWALAQKVAADQASYPSTTWVHGTANNIDRPMTVTWDYNMCGKVLWSSYHTQSPGGGKSSDPDSGPGTPFPSYCKSTPKTMIAQEKILEYLIFQISACLGPIL
jgi:hypothetical protein